MSGAFMCGCVIARPGSDAANHYCSRHLPPAGVEVLYAEIARLQAEAAAMRVALDHTTRCPLAVQARSLMGDVPEKINACSGCREALLLLQGQDTKCGCGPDTTCDSCASVED